MAIAHILKPAPEGGAAQLFLLFCDAGQSWQEMTPLGEALGKAFGSAAIVALQGPHAVGEDHGWLEPVGETQAGATDTPMEGRALLTAWEDEALAGAIEAALPGCIGSIRSWQAQMKVLPEATALIGVGEGATMALAAAMASAGDGHPVCGRVSTVGGRFGPVPDAVSPTLVLHLVHGKADQSVHFRHSVKTAEDLVEQSVLNELDQHLGLGQDPASTVRAVQFPTGGRVVGCELAGPDGTPYSMSGNGQAVSAGTIACPVTTDDPTKPWLHPKPDQYGRRTYASWLILHADERGHYKVIGIGRTIA